MTSKNWRDDLDLVIDANLNELIKETKDFQNAISKSKDKSKAQIWVALAIINHKINKLQYEKKEYEKKIPPEELVDIVKKLENL